MKAIFILSFIFLHPIFGYGFSDVLYIGDEHSLMDFNKPEDKDRRLGHVMVDAADSMNVLIAYYAACGSRPLTWMGSSTRSTCGVSIYLSGAPLSNQKTGSVPSFKEALLQTNAKHILINLGDHLFNSFKNEKPKILTAPTETSEPSQKNVTDEIQKMLSLIPKGKSCVWVGPTYHTKGPDFVKSKKEVDRLYNLLKTALGSTCKLSDSRPVFAETEPTDGLHLTPEESRKWGQSISRLINVNKP